MTQKTKQIIRNNIVTLFGSLGYLFGFLQWLWATTLYLGVIQSAALYVAPASDVHVERTPDLTFALPDVVDMVILGVIVIVMIAVMVYVLIRMPRGIVKTSNKIVYKTAKTMAPVVIKAQHKHDTKKSRAKITSKLMPVIKLVLILVPLLLTAGSRLLEEPSIDYSIALIVGGGLACFSVVFFVVEHTLARVFRVKV